MVRYTVCSYCNREFTGVSHVSRRDYKTQICGVCADFEAFRELFIQNIKQPTKAAFETLNQAFLIRLGSTSA